MIKTTLYPKTKRISSKADVVITEKLDGSNLGIFKLDNKLVVAQRNSVFTWNRDNTDLDKGNSYKGLLKWLDQNGDYLLENLVDGSGVFGEWIGMGKIKYGDALDKKFYIFAKANIDSELNLTNLYYDRSLFIYPFANQEVPQFVGVVPLVAKLSILPNIEDLDSLYEKYCALENRPVEGFVINNNNQIQKYVRLKGGVLRPHKE